MNTNETRLRQLFDLMVERAKGIASFDQLNGSNHDASTLFSACGSSDLMFALRDVYLETKEKSESAA